MIFSDPLHQNLLAMTATILYVASVVHTCDRLVAAEVASPRITRKMVHVAAGSWILFWPMFDERHGSWRLNVVVPAVYTVVLLAQGIWIRDATDPTVQSMTRTGDPTELLYGPVWFTVVMVIVGLFAFETPMAVLLMSCLGWGDGIAPLVGYYFPWGTYVTGDGGLKTLSGTLGFVASSMLGYTIMKSLVLGDSPSPEIVEVWPIVVLAAVTEGVTGKFDNICIPIVVYLCYEHMFGSEGEAL